jgi:hypothetical protein
VIIETLSVCPRCSGRMFRDGVDTLAGASSSCIRCGYVAYDEPPAEVEEFESRWKGRTYFKRRRGGVV